MALGQAHPAAAAIALGAWLSLAAASARATPPPDAVQLAWVRGEGADACADGAAVAREVVRRMGHDPFTTDATRSIEVVVARAPTGWVARIYFRDGDGMPASVREVSTASATCDALTDIAAVAIVLGIDPDAPPPAPPPAPTPPPPTVLPAATPREPTAPPRRAPRGLIRPHGGGVTLRGVGVVGALPGPSAGGALAIDGHVRGPVRWNAGAFLPADRDAATPPPGPQTIGFTLGGGWVEGCAEIWPLARVALSGCAGLMLGLIAPHDPSARFSSPYLLWGGPMLDARAVITLASPLVLELGLQGVATLADPTFKYRVAEPGTPPMDVTVFQSAVAAAMAYVGLGVQF